MKKEYEYIFIRRFLKLDKERRIFTLLKDEKICIHNEDINVAFYQLLEKIDKEEGTSELIEDAGRSTCPYTGLYFDRELNCPQLPSMERMCIRGDVFDYIFYSEGGRYNGEYNKFLYLENIFYEGIDQINVE